jgi:hypothetical protein
MDLSSLYGYPTWDKALYMRLQPHFATMCRLFAAYAAPPPRTEADLSPKPLEQWSADLTLYVLDRDLHRISARSTYDGGHFPNRYSEQWGGLMSDMGLDGHGLERMIYQFGAPPRADAAATGAHGGGAAADEPAEAEPEDNGARTLSAFIAALVGVAFAVNNPGYEAAKASGDVDVERLVLVPDAADELLQHRVPFTLMRRCLARLNTEVELAKALMNDKQAKLQQARTRERNFLIEAAGALKRKENSAAVAEGRTEEEKEGRRGRRRRGDGDGDAHKVVVDPAALRADVDHRQVRLAIPEP